jgi:hypothetical protein
MRALSILVVVLATSGLATGDQVRAPAPPAPGKVPMTLVPCLPPDVELDLRSQNGDPVICWGASCMKLTDDGAAMVPPPPAKPAWFGPRAEVRDEGGKPAVCSKAGCKPAGPKLAAAIVEERKSAAADGQTPRLAATADRKAVVVGSEVWSLAGDKPLKLKAPASYKRGGGDPPGIVGIDVAGDVLVVDWTDCAGPCTRGQIVDSGGKNKGADFAGGGPVFQLDAKRFVVISEYAEVQIFSLAGKPLGAIQLGDEPSYYSAIALDDGTIGVLREARGGHRLAVIQAYEDASARVTMDHFLPTCAP